MLLIRQARRSRALRRRLARLAQMEPAQRMIPKVVQAMTLQLVRMTRVDSAAARMMTSAIRDRVRARSRRPTDRRVRPAMRCVS